MKKYVYLLLLIMQANSSFASDRFSQFMHTTPAQKIEAIHQSAQNLLKELQGLKQCRMANNCTKAQYDRIKQLGKKIGAAVVVLVGTGIIAGLGVRARMAPMEPTMWNAADEFKVDFAHPTTGENDRKLLEKMAGVVDDKFGLYDLSIPYSLRGLKAALWIIDNRKSKDQYEKNLFAKAYDALDTRIKELENKNKERE